MGNAHRTKKRIWEIELTVDVLKYYLRNKNPDEVQVLQFGCGNGDQVTGLKVVGNVVASDIYTDEAVQELHVPFVECSIADTPFSDGQFDVIHSNHVMEHIVDLQGAFGELKRIAKEDCVYAFAVPTSMWMILAWPAKYAGKLKQGFRLLVPSQTGGKIIRNPSGRIVSNDELRAKLRQSKISRILKRVILPGGHGVPGGFAACVSAFRPSQWRQLFESNGFLIEREVPLLIYGPSNFPVVPTLRAKNKYLVSSLLFIMRKKGFAEAHAGGSSSSTVTTQP